MADEIGDASYVIRTGDAALERLELLARLFWPTTRTLLARNDVFDADRLLDVGCGIGDVVCRASAEGVEFSVGIDVNRAVIDAAERRCKSHGGSASFFTRSIGDLDRESELADFDVVYARCLISHTSEPAEALASLCAAAKPGGLVVIEDVQVDAVWCSPPSRALARHAELYLAAAFGLGAHPDVAPAIPPLLRELNATDVSVDVVQPLLREQADLQIHARTMEAIAESVLAQGLATEGELRELVDELDDLAKTPGVVATLPRIVQVTARAPL